MKTLSEELVKIAHWGLQDYVAVLFWGSGTICIDVCINSLLDKDKYAFVINNGSYSQRAVDILKAYGMQYIELKQPIDTTPDLKIIEEEIKKIFPKEKKLDMFTWPITKLFQDY